MRFRFWYHTVIIMITSCIKSCLASYDCISTPAKLFYRVNLIETPSSPFFNSLITSILNCLVPSTWWEVSFKFYCSSTTCDKCVKLLYSIMNSWNPIFVDKVILKFNTLLYVFIVLSGILLSSLGKWFLYFPG